MNRNQISNGVMPVFLVILLAASAFADCTDEDEEIIDVKGSTMVLPIVESAAEK